MRVTELVAELDRVFDGVIVPVFVCDGVRVRDIVFEGDTRLGVPVGEKAEPVIEGVALFVGVTVLLTLTLGVKEGVPLLDGVFVRVSVGDGVTVGVEGGAAEPVRVRVDVGEIVGVFDCAEIPTQKL